MTSTRAGNSVAHGDDAALDALLLLADTDLVILDDRRIRGYIVPL